MSNTRNTTAGIAAEIAKGWQPNNYLTNMSMAYFQKPEDYVAHSIFPVCPVQLSASYYYTFSKISIHALREEGDSKNRDKISIFKQIIQHSARI